MKTTGPVVAWSILVLAIAFGNGCGFEAAPQQHSNVGGPVVDPGAAPRTVQLPLEEAPCTIHVDGYGDIDIEEDYIPNVVACENGNAPMEALKAQAIQARGYIYYKIFIEGSGSVVNSTADQVYDCSYASAEQRHYEAARATRAEYLTWNDEIIATFYVAGAIPADQDSGSPAEACVGTGGNDPTGTEQWVTYNLGKSECDIDMTPLGWVPDDCYSNPQNRGCASQNGQACLANRGWEYTQMMPYYYGDDIVIQRAGGSCGGPFEEPTAYDLHCQDQGDDGWSCFDQSERVHCSGDEADQIDSCDFGCELGECSEPVDEFCHEKPDGWYCYDGATRAQCESELIVDTDNCTAGCEDGQCVPTGQSPDDGSGKNDTASQGQGEQFSLVVESPGISGGCSLAGKKNTPSALLALLFALFWLRRRAHFVP